MNYNMQGITETIPKALHDAEIDEGWQDHEFQVKGQREEWELQAERQASCCSSEKAQV